MNKPERIRKLRESLGWSQRFLADQVGLANCTVSRAETDRGKARAKGVVREPVKP